MAGESYNRAYGVNTLFTSLNSNLKFPTHFTGFVGHYLYYGVNSVIQAMVNVQMLSELEEVMQFKLVPERQEAIKHMWWDRLQGCQRVVEDWQKIIQVRSLVVSPLEDMKTWLKYASLCRKSGRLVSGRLHVNSLYVRRHSRPQYFLYISFCS